jgi:polysaccharide export outer membrane protein
MLTGLARHYGWGMFAQPVVVEAEFPKIDLAIMTKAPRAQIVSAPLPVAPKTIDRAEVAWRSIGAVWLLASIGLTLRLLRSALAVRHLYLSAVPCSSETLLAELKSASDALGVAAPELCVSQAIDSPALAWWGRTRLILPADHLSIGQWQAVFCHELAHIARRDGQSRLGFELLVAVLPWQPLAWLLRREFRAACEQACDDWSVAAGADPVELAALLIDFIPQSRPALVLGMSETAPATRSRILRLLTMQSSPQPRLGRAFALSGWLVAVVLAVMLALMQRSRRGGSDAGELPPWGDKPASVAAANVHPAGDPGARRAYRVQPPDVLLIEGLKIVPKAPYKIGTLDEIDVVVLGTLPDQPIAGDFHVASDGKITLGPAYGSVKVLGLTLPEATEEIAEHLKRQLTAPEVSVQLSKSAGAQQIAGEHLVGPDGTVNLGSYGSVYVAGLTLPEIRTAIEKHLSERLENPQVSVVVYAYNSLVYYVISEGPDSGDVVTRVPWTGSETVLDAVAESNVSHQNLSLADCWVWISRPATANSQSQVLPVDWQGIVEKADTKTNWQVLPGDRVFIRKRGN